MVPAASSPTPTPRLHVPVAAGAQARAVQAAPAMAATPTTPATGAVQDMRAPPAARRGPAGLSALLFVLSLAYPVVVYLALGRVEPRWIALLLVVLALARALATREPFWFAAAALAGVLAGASLAGGWWGPLQLYPALVNLVLLALFGLSLWRGPTVVERLARLREPDLPPAARVYTRRVTQVWCAFFLVNGGLAVATTAWASPAAWALYNGGIAYLAMGALMGGEWLVRRRVRARIAARPAAADDGTAEGGGGTDAAVEARRAVDGDAGACATERAQAHAPAQALASDANGARRARPAVPTRGPGATRG